MVKGSGDSSTFPHWTLKELYEQPEAIARALGFGGRLGSDRILLGGLDGNFDRLSKIKHLMIAACGTSLHAAKYGEKLMKHLGSFDTVYSLDAAETNLGDLPCPGNTNARFINIGYLFLDCLSGKRFPDGSGGK